jgi:hypothetical protein
MLMFDLDRFAFNASCVRRLRNGTKGCLGMRLHACFVRSRRVLDHPRVGRECMKRRQDRQDGSFGADPLGQGEAELDSLAGEFRPVRWYQDVSVHCPLIGQDLNTVAESTAT